MKMLFIGGAFPKEMEAEILEKSKGTVHYAANKLQWNLIDGLINTNKIEMKIVSAPFVGTYPKEYKGLFVNEYSYTYNDSIQCEYVSFCNLWGYRNISRKNSLKKQICEFLQVEAINKAIVVYSPHTPFLQAATYAKQKDPSIHLCLIVPDLPQYMNLNKEKSAAYKKLKEIDIKIFEKNSKHVDSFVLLTEHMKDILEVNKRPYVVVEGMVKVYDSNLDERVISEEVIKSVVYTGSINNKFGIINLIKAFNEIDDPNVVLKICGSGDSENLINEYVKKNDRIHFLGQLSNEDAVNLQKNATVLVNPRQDNEEFTKYSFPSKNMEYLLSGKPVIAYKLKGIPDEYDDYFFYVKDNDNDIKSLKNKINEVINLTIQERYEFGKKAKEFVIKDKNNNQASLKIFNMIKDN